MIEFFRNLLSLPTLASKHGQEVDDMIIYVHWLMIALFIGWLAYFAYALFRFRQSRNPKADYVGVKGHASNWLEGAVAIVEGVLLLGFAIPMWAKMADANQFPKEDEATVLQVFAQQFQWNLRYAGPDHKLGRQDPQFVNADNKFGVDRSDPVAKDDFDPPANEMHVPVNKPALVYISSLDVIHSFKIIALRICQDAIPGMRIPTHFTPTRVGKYQINCAQLCGNGHASMAAGFLYVDTQEDFDKWIQSKKGSAAVSYE